MDLYLRMSQIKDYTPKEIDLSEYMEGKMEVEEVSTIGEAVTYTIAEYDFKI